jgi:endonuclease-3
MTRKERFAQVLAYFQQHQPTAETELNYTNPYELLVAVVLSAQCTDKRVNLTTPKLFERFPDVDSLANSTVDEVFELIHEWD